MYKNHDNALKNILNLSVITHVVAEEFNDVVKCCIENMIKAWIKDFVTSFHGTNSRDILQRFRIGSGKVRLANKKTLDILGFGDVVLKNYLGTSWTLKDVMCIRGLDTHGNKRVRLHMVEVHSNGINAAINGRGTTNLWH
ncbi:hypothetical protein Tco_0994306 [Tanacetum coccineum]